MQPIVYDVAVSIDGFISGRSNDISRFAQEGPVVEDYQERLAGYGTAIMGRNTYEFGYGFGLEPGQNPYPHMETYVFSTKIDLPRTSDVTVVREDIAATITSIKAAAKKPVYLCGGGRFAAALMTLGLVDRLILKRAPVLLGTGVRLLEDEPETPHPKFVDSRAYADGYLLQEYEVIR